METDLNNNKEQNQLLSIIIPTKNRQYFAKYAILSIIETQINEIELVIQDNSDTNELETWISNNIIDKRISYRHHKEPLSFIENFSKAVELATGEYICIIGDDDTINPEIVEATKWMKNNNIDCLAIQSIANYIWPNSGVQTTLFTKNVQGILSLSEQKSTIIYPLIEKELELFANSGGFDYLKFNLPKLYHGIVNRDCLEAIKNKTGAYFGGLSPDIFASIAISCTTNRIAVTNYPLTVPGACQSSASIIEGLLKKNSKVLEDAPHFRNRGNYTWNQLVPRIYSVETIWADSSISALKSMGRYDLISSINLPKLTAYCAFLNPELKPTITNCLKNGLKTINKNPIIGKSLYHAYKIAFLTHKILDTANRIYNRIKIIIGTKKLIVFKEVNNTVEAQHTLCTHLKKSGYNFSLCTQQNPIQNRN